MTTTTKKSSALAKVSDKALLAVCLASASFYSMSAVADDDPLAKFGDYNAAKDAKVGIGEGSGIQNTLANAFNILKVVFVLVGFGLFGGGVLRVVKASKTEGQQSQAPGWIMIALGSFLSVAGFLFFAFGQGIQDALTSS